MLYYARCDTHYLLYVYDVLRNELVSRSDQSDPQKNLIGTTVQRSKEVSLDRYVPFGADTTTGEGARGWGNLLQKSFTNLDGPQFSVYRAVHKWRDDLARQEDENPNYIMPQQTVMEIAKILPGDPKALWSLMGNKCSQKAKQSLDQLFGLISEARNRGVDGPSTTAFFRGTFESHSGSMAAVAKRELGKETRPELDLPPVEQLRSQKSQLFGSLPVSSVWEGPKKTNTNIDDKLISLPWTHFVQDAVKSASQQEATIKAKEDIDMIPLEDKPAVPAAEAAMDNTEFTLRQGRKRKLEEVEAEESDSDGEEGEIIDTQDMISLDVDEPQVNRRARKKAEKAARKAAERAEREAKRQAKAEKKQNKSKQVTGKDESEEDDAPFDYSKAQSVLHAQRTMTATNTNNETQGRKKAFDPYAARMNAEGPKAARRMHSERPGKTATFKK